MIAVVGPGVTLTAGDLRALIAAARATDAEPARIVDALLRDLTSRRGLRQEWEQIDEDVRATIVRAWRGIVAREVAP